MKKKKIIRIVWIIVSLMVIFSMVIMTLSLGFI